jgi:hypothetical protein
MTFESNQPPTIAPISAVLYVASEGAAFVTGQILTAEGGETATF